MEKSSFESEILIIRLCSNLRILLIIISALCVHVIDHPDRQEIQLTDVDAKLYAAEQKQRGCHFPINRPEFFLASTSVLTFNPQSSINFGST